MLEAGKRYEWKTGHMVGKNPTLKDGLFTGKYEEYHGMPIFQTREGETWAVPENHVWEYKKKR